MDSRAWLALQQLVTQEERGHCTAGSPALVRAFPTWFACDVNLDL